MKLQDELEAERVGFSRKQERHRMQNFAAHPVTLSDFACGSAFSLSLELTLRGIFLKQKDPVIFRFPIGSTRFYARAI